MDLFWSYVECRECLDCRYSLIEFCPVTIWVPFLSLEKLFENLVWDKDKRNPITTDADYADDIAILANTSNHAKTLLYSLEQAAAGIDLHVNAHKTEYMCFNQTGNITILDGSSLKRVEKFTYLGSSVSSTEKGIDTRLTKVWTAIDKLTIIWKSDLIDKMKKFLPSSSRIDTAIWMHLLDAIKTAGEKARRQLHKNAASNIEQIPEETPHKKPTIRTPASHHEDYPS